jgi:hypothetical protein
MKAKSVIIAAVLFLQVSILFAENDEVRPATSNTPATMTLTALAPVTPAEANFEEISYLVSDVVASLAPVVPAEADFSDVSAEKNPDLKFLEPVTPCRADFCDYMDVQVKDLDKLAPTTPSEAEFE